MTTHPTPAADQPPGVEDQDHAPAATDAPAARLSRVGVAGLLHPGSIVERLQERRDSDRAKWLGVDSFTRRPTPPEQQLISSVPGVRDPT